MGMKKAVVAAAVLAVSVIAGANAASAHWQEGPEGSDGVQQYIAQVGRRLDLSEAQKKHLAEFAATLTPEQREKVAKRVAWMDHGPGRHGRGGWRERDRHRDCDRDCGRPCNQDRQRDRDRRSDESRDAERGRGPDRD